MLKNSEVSIDEHFELDLLKKDRNFFQDLDFPLSAIFPVFFFTINHFDCFVNQNNHIAEKV